MMFVNTGRELRVIATLAALSISGQRKEGWKRSTDRYLYSIPHIKETSPWNRQRPLEKTRTTHNEEFYKCHTHLRFREYCGKQ